MLTKYIVAFTTSQSSVYQSEVHAGNEKEALKLAKLEAVLHGGQSKEVIDSCPNRVQAPITCILCSEKTAWAHYPDDRFFCESCNQYF